MTRDVGGAARRARSRRWGFVAVAYAFAAVMFGTTVPTPLYPLYQQEFGFGEFMVTVVFATYAVGVLAALLLAGGLSDVVGRRAVLLPGIALSALSAVTFLTAGGVPALFVGRALSGLSAGLITGTATATLLDLATPSDRGRDRASLVATLVNVGGLGLGPLVAGVLSTAFGAPLRVPFAVALALLVPAVAGIWLMPEPVVARGAFSIRPTRLGLPPEVRGVFVPAAVAGFAGFVVLGLFTAVGPAALGQLLGVTNRAAIGAVVFAVFAASTAGQVALEVIDAARALPVGCIVLTIGMAVLVAGLQVPSLALLVLGGILGGFGQGLSFRAGMATVNAATPPAHRGEVTSLLFVVLYVGISIPVVSVGLGAQVYGLLAAGTSCAIVVASLGVLAFGILRGRRASQSQRGARSREL